MSDEINRRAALQALVAIPAGLLLTSDGIERAAAHAHAATAPPRRPRSSAALLPAYVPTQFTLDEWALVRLLADLVIPRDDRSGSATDAGVPEFMDFVLGEFPSNRSWMKDGLAWLNAEARTRTGHSFVSASDAARRELLDQIAFPAKAAASMKDGAAFFSRFRDLAATGFFTSKIGYADLGYMGNVPNFEWVGTPDHVIRAMKL